MGVRTPTDRRFRRAHLRPGRRRRLTARRRFLVRALVVTVVVVAGGRWLIGAAQRSTVLTIATVAVEGNQRVSRGELLALVDALRGQNVLVADLEAARARLLSSGWIEDAKLRRVLPSTIAIVVTEREPVGIGRFGSRLYLVDARGAVIGEYGPRFASIDLPIIDGLSAGGAEGRVSVDHGRAALAAKLMQEVGTRERLAARISQVDVRDPNDAVVLLAGDPALIHLGSERFVERLEVYLDLAPALRARVPEIDYVDLRFDRRVYVGPANDDARAAPPANVVARRRMSAGPTE